MEEQIPKELLKRAKGIVFLTTVKASLGIGASAGTGVIVARGDFGDGWSAPCAIGMGGVQWGFNIGASKVDTIIVLRTDDSLKTFSGKGQLKLGADAGIAV